MSNKTLGKERFFTVELNSKRNLKNVTLSNGGSDIVLVEGTIGEFVQAAFADSVVFEVIGKNGVLRIDLSQDEIIAKQMSAEVAKHE
jgi:hypothetical protein